ncbi:MAG TPA: energy-coupling factor transporter transmembrane protein EcfT [Acidimicrobiales bacterium]|nr:energy-coupling factor transporter transmembrane protein EcfT [Acidimicrobiales bacterium]
MHLFRLVPGNTPIHRLWAGTKLLYVLAAALTLTLVPTWSTIAIFAVLDLVAARLAKLPRSVVPRIPVWFWVSLLIAMLVALLAGGPPALVVGSVHIGLGSLATFLRAVSVGVVLLATSAIVGWTTSLGDIAPAVSRLGGPLRRLRLPVDELALTVALCVRSLPLLVDEMRTLSAARRLRPRWGSAGHGGEAEASERRHGYLRSRLHRVLVGPTALLGAALAVSLRRAGELGEAITGRGGPAVGVGTRAGPAGRDLVAGVATVAACTFALVLYWT